jgi:predicted transcriptional regulator
MNEIAVDMLDGKSLELIEILVTFGMTRNEASLIAYLSDVEVATSRKIEAGTGLKQPEVSTGMMMLRSRDWILEEEIKNEKGRPTKIYALKVTLADIVKYLEEKKVRDADQARNSIQKLRELAPFL